MMLRKDKLTNVRLKANYEAKVLSVDWDRKGEHGKTLRLRYKGQRGLDVSFRVPRSACVTEGDIILSTKQLDEKASMENDAVFIKCKNGLVQLTPIYSVESILKIGALNITIKIKEVSEQDEYNGYVALTRYHYREKTLFGRHAALVAVAEHPLLPKVIAYIDLTTAFFVNTPRRSILDEPTRLNGISWKKWSKDTIRKHIPLFVRVARCVVHPELRAMGLGKLLIENAADFARSRWQSAHWKPYFLEISADMLRYIPFAEKAGMVFVGETEGNLERIAKDMTYLKANEDRLQKDIFKGEVFGILDTKLSQLQKATAAVNGSGQNNLGDFITRQIKRPTLSGWAKLAGVLSVPKPHYMMGLNKEAKELINQRLRTRNNSNTSHKDGQAYIQQIYQTRLQQKIVLGDVGYQINFSVRRTKTTHQIERSFEISLDNLSQPILKNLNFDILPGEVVVITGLSGTGKTTLIKMLARTILPTTGKLSIPEDANIAQLSSLSSSKPLIEVIGQGDAGKGMYWLGVVGLSEPFLLIKSFAALSAGQKYRAMIATLLAQGSNLWLIDEFCENLDLINTHLLARKLAVLARKVGATVVIASSDAERFVKSLLPDKVIILKGATDTDSFNILSGEKFINKMRK